MGEHLFVLLEPWQVRIRFAPVSMRMAPRLVLTPAAMTPVSQIRTSSGNLNARIGRS
ncbi:MAG: hypothetical protein ACT443_07060 [Gemmatimonadota bacterium]